VSKQDDNIVKCARRMIAKLDKKGQALKYNGEYHKSVQVEIKRMKDHCADKPSPLPAGFTCHICHVEGCDISHDCC